jgi:hypothetical protein
MLEYNDWEVRFLFDWEEEIGVESICIEPHPEEVNLSVEMNAWVDISWAQIREGSRWNDEEDVDKIKWGRGELTLEFDDELVDDNGERLIYFCIDPWSHNWEPEHFYMYGKRLQGGAPAFFSDSEIAKLRRTFLEQEGWTPSMLDDGSEDDQENIGPNIAQSLDERNDESGGVVVVVHGGQDSAQATAEDDAGAALTEREKERE